MQPKASSSYAASAQELKNLFNSFKIPKVDIFAFGNFNGSSSGLANQAANELWDQKVLLFESLFSDSKKGLTRYCEVVVKSDPHMVIILSGNVGLNQAFGILSDYGFPFMVVHGDKMHQREFLIGNAFLEGNLGDENAGIGTFFENRPRLQSCDSFMWWATRKADLEQLLQIIRSVKPKKLPGIDILS